METREVDKKERNDVYLGILGWIGVMEKKSDAA